MPTTHPITMATTLEELLPLICPSLETLVDVIDTVETIITVVTDVTDGVTDGVTDVIGIMWVTILVAVGITDDLIMPDIIVLAVLIVVDISDAV